MTDVTQLSDDQLMALVNGGQAPAAPPSDLTKLSDDDLLRLAHGQSPGSTPPAPSKPAPSIFSDVMNADLGQLAAHMGTGIVANLAAAGNEFYNDARYGGSTPGIKEKNEAAAKWLQDTYTYQPSDPAAQRILGYTGTAMAAPGEGAARLAKVLGASPEYAEGVRARTNNAVNLGAGVLTPYLLKGASVAGSGVLSGIRSTIDAGQNALGISSPQSISAARVPPINPGNSIALNRALSDSANRNGGVVPNGTAIDNYQLAERIHPNFRPSAGQASGNVDALRWEINNADKIPGFVQQQEVNRQILSGEMQSMRQRLAPDAPNDNLALNRDQIEQYEQYHDARRASINADYENARSLVDPNEPILDAKDLLDRVRGAEDEHWITTHPDIMGRLQKIAESPSGQMSMKQFEGLRTRLAELARSEDGSERYAAGIVRGEVESSDFLPQAQAAKAAFDQARANAAENFERLRNDKAYAAVVKGNAQPENFMESHATTSNGAAQMRATLAGNSQAAQNLAAHHIDQLTNAARMNTEAGQTGNFAVSSLAKRMQDTKGALVEALGPESASRMDDIRDAARMITPDRQRIMASTSNSASPMVAALQQMGGKVVKDVPVVGPIIEGGINLGGVLSRQALARRTMSRYGGLDLSSAPVPPPRTMGGGVGIRQPEPVTPRPGPRTPPNAGGAAPPPSGGGTPPPQSGAPSPSPLAQALRQAKKKSAAAPAPAPVPTVQAGTPGVTHPIPPAPGASITNDAFEAAYNQLKTENGGLSTVRMKDLAERLGVPPQDLHAFLMPNVKAGGVTIHPSNVTPSPEVAAAGIRVPNIERPFVTVVRRGDAPPLVARPGQPAAAAGASIDNAAFDAAYNQLKGEQRGLSAIPISSLASRMGVQPTDLHQFLLRNRDAGALTLHPATTAGVSPEMTAAGIRVPGVSEPYVTVARKARKPLAGQPAQDVGATPPTPAGSPEWSPGSFRPIETVPHGFDPNDIPDLSNMSRAKLNAAAKSTADAMVGTHGLDMARDTALAAWGYFDRGAFKGGVEKAPTAAINQLQAKARYWGAVHDRMTAIRDAQDAARSKALADALRKSRKKEQP